MATKRNDFDKDAYVQKVDNAHTQLKNVDGRLKRLESLSDGSLIFRTIRKDAEIKEEIESLIWQTIVKKCWIGFLWVLGAAILLPIISLAVSKIAFKLFGISL